MFGGGLTDKDRRRQQREKKSASHTAAHVWAAPSGKHGGFRSALLRAVLGPGCLEGQRLE